MILSLEGPQLLGVARRILIRADLAEEALQDAFVRAWRSLADQLQVRADVAEEMWERVKPAERVATSTTTTAEQRQSRQHRRNLGAKIATRAEGTAAD